MITVNIITRAVCKRIQIARNSSLFGFHERKVFFAHRQIFPDFSSFFLSTSKSQLCQHKQEISVKVSKQLCSLVYLKVCAVACSMGLDGE